jgi:hypothetical protein
MRERERDGNCQHFPLKFQGLCTSIIVHAVNLRRFVFHSLYFSIAVHLKALMEELDLLGIGFEYLELIPPARDRYSSISSSGFSMQKYRIH